MSLLSYEYLGFGLFGVFFEHVAHTFQSFWFKAGAGADFGTGRCKYLIYLWLQHFSNAGFNFFRWLNRLSLPWFGYLDYLLILLELLTRAEITFLGCKLNEPSSTSVETLVWTRG